MTQQQQQIQEIEEIEEWMGALNKMKTYYKKQSETENKILSVFSCIDTREIIMKQKEQIVKAEKEQEKTKMEKDLIDTYLTLKLSDEIEEVETQFIKRMIGDYFHRNQKNSSLRSLGELKTEEYFTLSHKLFELNGYGARIDSQELTKHMKTIKSKNEEYYNSKIEEIKIKFVEDTKYYFDKIEECDDAEEKKKQFTIKYDGIEYKLFNKNGHRIRKRTNWEFCEKYIKAENKGLNNKFQLDDLIMKKINEYKM
tara:strand:- start:99 stop:860 length:762 start_codon:yes stop_codon:yes gene_type:complete